MGCNIDQNAQDRWQRVSRNATLGFLVSEVMLVKKWQKISFCLQLPDALQGRLYVTL